MLLKPYQRTFLDLVIQAGVLRFGEFTLKSGRVSPYFFNAGGFRTGGLLRQLGQCYAQAIADYQMDFDMCFGPAYKGIPLVSTVVIALSELFQREVPFAFNRKEIKDHGEGGEIVGATLQGRVLLIDDVITAGTATRESVTLIQRMGAQPAGMMIALNRQERGQNSQHSAVREVEKTWQMPVCAIVTLNDLMGYLEQDSAQASSLERIRAYRVQYGEFQ